MPIQRDPHALFMLATRMLRNTQMRHRTEALRDNGRMSHDISPAEARARALRGALLIDIRQPHERVSGQAEGGLAIAQADLEQAPAQHLPDRDRDILLICQSGKRSAQTAAQLREQGYPHALSVLGGTTAWSRDGRRWYGRRCRQTKWIFWNATHGICACRRWASTGSSAWRARVFC